MASWACRLTNSLALSSRLQRVAWQSWVAVFSEAIALTSTRSGGGKRSGSTRSWGVLQTGQTVAGEAFPPLADGMSIAVEFLGDGLIGGLIDVGSAEDDAAAKDESLWCGSGPDERFELSARIGGQVDQGTEGKWH